MSHQKKLEQSHALARLGFAHGLTALPSRRGTRVDFEEDVIAPLDFTALREDAGGQSATRGQGPASKGIVKRSKCTISSYTQCSSEIFRMTLRVEMMMKC